MKAGLAKPTVRLHFAALRTFFRFLTERHGLKDNPLKQVQLPKMDRGLPVVLSRQQIDALLAAPLTMEKSDRAPKWMPQRDAAILELFTAAACVSRRSQRSMCAMQMNSPRACACWAKDGRSAWCRWVISH